MSDTAKKNTQPGAFSIFKFFFGISAVTIGGGYVMIPVIARKLEKKGWLGEADFYTIFAAAQSLPGPLALNSAMLTGYKLRGYRGFAAGLLGIIVPPFISILLLARVLIRIGNAPFVQGFLEGAFAVVPGLTASLLYAMIKKRAWTKPRLALSIAAAAACIVSGTWAVPCFFLFVFVSWLTESYFACSK